MRRRFHQGQVTAIGGALDRALRDAREVRPPEIPQLRRSYGVVRAPLHPGWADHWPRALSQLCERRAGRRRLLGPMAVLLWQRLWADGLSRALAKRDRLIVADGLAPGEAEGRIWAKPKAALVLPRSQKAVRYVRVKAGTGPSYWRELVPMSRAHYYRAVKELELLGVLRVMGRWRAGEPRKSHSPRVFAVAHPGDFAFFLEQSREPGMKSPLVSPQGDATYTYGYRDPDPPGARDPRGTEPAPTAPAALSSAKPLAPCPAASPKATPELPELPETTPDWLRELLASQLAGEKKQEASECDVRNPPAG